MKQWVCQLAAACLLWPATIAVAEPVPFSSLVPLLQKAPDSVFAGLDGASFVVDTAQNLVWMFDANGGFEEVLALVDDGNLISLIGDGEEVGLFDVHQEAEWGPIDVKVNMPSSRRIFQAITNATLQSDAGSLLPEGSVFDDYFTIYAPSEHVLLWRPASDAQGIFVQDTATGQQDFIAIAALGAALGIKE